MTQHNTGAAHPVLQLSLRQKSHSNPLCHRGRAVKDTNTQRGLKFRLSSTALKGILLEQEGSKKAGMPYLPPCSDDCCSGHRNLSSPISPCLGYAPCPSDNNRTMFIVLLIGLNSWYAQPESGIEKALDKSQL